MGGSSSSSSQRIDKRTYVTDNSQEAATDDAVISGGDVFQGQGVTASKDSNVTINSIDRATVSDAFEAGQLFFDRSLDTVDKITSAYGDEIKYSQETFSKTLENNQKTLSDAVQKSASLTSSALEKAEGQDAETTKTLAYVGLAGLAFLAFFMRGKK